MTYQMPAQREMISEEQKTAWWIPAIVTGMFVLFFAAVGAAGVSIRASYTLAQLQVRQSEALHQQQVLSEQLAQVSSLAYVHAYAAESGFVENSTPIATINLTTSVAQR